MHLIKKKDDNYCVLACIESLLQDYKKKTISQEELIDLYAEQTRKTIPGQKGSVDTNKEIVEILADLGFDACDNKTVNPKSECFVLTRNSSHCCRYQGKIDENGQHIVMDPDIGQLTTMTDSKMTESSTTFVKIDDFKNLKIIKPNEFGDSQIPENGKY